MSDTPKITPERQALLLGLAQQAASWWRKKIEGPGYLSKFDNGDTSRDGEFGRVLASLATLKTPQPASEQFDRFEQVLTEAIHTRLLREPKPAEPDDLVLDVDYGPNRLLGEAAREAGVGGFPWKTTMWVCWAADPMECYVEVRAGYGRPTERLPTVGDAPTSLAS